MALFMMESVAETLRSPIRNFVLLLAIAFIIPPIFEHSRRRLQVAQTMSQSFSVPLDPVLRIEYSIPQAICHVSREKDADFIVLGMGRTLKIEAPLLTTVHDDVS